VDTIWLLDGIYTDPLYETSKDLDIQIAVATESGSDVNYLIKANATYDHNNGAQGDYKLYLTLVD